MFFFSSEIHEIKISKWKIDDSAYLETHNFPAMLDQVRNQPYVTFVGVPGSGKTAIARHIALKLEMEGYELLPIIDKNKLEDYCDPRNPQVFLLDDVLGVFGLDMAEYNTLCKYEDNLMNPVMPNTKIIMTSREVVYRNETLSDSFLLKKENVIFLHSTENALNDQDKIGLLALYQLDTDLLTPDNLASSSKMFPFLCKLFSKERGLKSHGPTFFSYPVRCILQELDKMQKRNQLHYASLVSLMVDAHLSDKTLLSENQKSSCKEIKCDFLRKCKVPENTDNFKFHQSLSEMEGTYTKKNGNTFLFIHDTMLEIITCHFGRQSPELILQYMCSDYIANYIKVDTLNTKKRKRETEDGEDVHLCNEQGNMNGEDKTGIDLIIELQETYYPLLADRLYRDLAVGELYNVFGIGTLKHPSVTEAFIAVLKRKTYDEMYNTFLSNWMDDFESERISCICDFFTSIDINGLLKDIVCGEDYGEYFELSIRPISWVIYYGYHTILQYIINQILQKKGNVDDLFENELAIKLERSMNKKIIYSRTDCDTDSDIDFDTDSKQMLLEQWRLFCLSCYSGDIKTVQILLKHINEDVINNKVTPNNRLYDTLNPLSIACKFGYYNIVMVLLKQGADVNLYSDNETPLTAASQFGHLEIVLELLKAGASVNKSSGLYTPLQKACKKGHLSVVKTLLTTGAGCFERPMIDACEGGHLSVVKVLITAGVDVNLEDGTETPILAACSNGHLDVVNELIKAGAHISFKNGHEQLLIAACDGGNISVIELLISAGSVLDPVALYQGNTIERSPAHACYVRHLKLIQNMIESGTSLGHNNVYKTPFTSGKEAAVNIKDGENTPLVLACYQGHLNVVQKLIKDGADVNLGNGLISPLQTACYKSHLCIIKALIKAGADVNQTYGDVTALTSACFLGNTSVVQELIKAGVNVDLKFKEETPLIVACMMKRATVVKELIKAGADINISDGDQTPLIAAITSYRISVISDLIDSGADVNLRVGNKTPLTLACSTPCEMIANDLIEAGACVNQSNGNQTPLIIACNEGDLELVKILLKAGAFVGHGNGDNTPLDAAYNQENPEIRKCLLKAIGKCQSEHHI